MSVRAGEIIALEQQRLPCHIGKRIRETVARIQRRRMPAHAEVPPRYPCSCQVFGHNRYRLDRGVLKECVEFMACFRTATALNHNRRFQDTRDGHTARCSCQDLHLVAFRIGLPVQDCQKCRRVNNYLGKPCSS